MAEGERSISKYKEAAGKLKEAYKNQRDKLKALRGNAAEANKKASMVPAYALPVLGGGAGYVLGYADSMVRTGEVRTPVTIAAGAVAWAGSGLAAYFGSPTIATLAGTTAATAAGIVTHAAGFEKGSKMAAAA